MIAAEILATTFEFGESTNAVEIGDGVKVAIVKA
jgi:isoleucyl-tRNA synthetase